MISRVLSGIGIFMAAYLGIMVIPLAAMYLIMAVFVVFSELSFAGLPGLREFLEQGKLMVLLLSFAGFIIAAVCGYSCSSK